jgi:trk system potassium uptake protein TrkA
MKFIVLGLGNFGRALAVRLTDLGHEVIGVDNNIQKVTKLKEKITHTVCMDCTDRDAVSSLPLRDANAVVVAIGEDEASSLLATALLKQLNIKRIIGRVVSDLQKTVLEAMEIDDYILPEEESAERLAVRLADSSIIDSFKISEKFSIIEVVAPEKVIGLSIEEAQITRDYQVIVLTILTLSKGSEDGVTKKYRYAKGVATPSTIIQKGDILVLFGELVNINQMLQDSK